MSIFDNPFFSIKGQEERLANVGATLNAAFNPFSKDTVQANVDSPILKTTLETASNHPYLVAGAVATVANPTGALAFGKASGQMALKAGSFIGKEVVKSAVAHPIPTAASVLIGAPLVAGVVFQKPSLVTDLPKESFNTGRKLVGVIQDHPVESAVIGGITGGVLAYEGYKALTGTSSTNTPSGAVLPTNSGGLVPTDISNAATQPITPATQVMGREISTSSRRRKKASKKINSTQNVRVQIVNQNFI